jgi:hypothetical protein
MGLIAGNLRTGRHQACRVKSELNLTYARAVNHYGIAVIPARVRRPKDKAKIEGGGDCPHPFILPFRKLPGSQCIRFEEFDRPAMRPLPETPISPPS